MNEKIKLEISNSPIAKNCCRTVFKLGALKKVLFFKNLSPCCQKACIKGLYVAAGNTALEKGTGYSLYLPLQNESTAVEIQECLKKVDIGTKIRQKGNLNIIYTKNSDAIADFLAYLDASEAALEIHQIKLQKETANLANRMFNCDIANVNKAVEAAQKQYLAVKKLQDTNKLNALPPKLKQTALARLNNPSSSITELIKLMGDNTTKSGFCHRMRKLIEISEDTNL
jgi:hypothetical protein